MINFVFVDIIGVTISFDFDIEIAEDMIKLILGRTDRIDKPISKTPY